MDKFELQFPEPHHKIAAESFKTEFFENNEYVINGSALLDQMEYDQWLINTVRNSRKDTVRSDWVVSTCFFAVRRNDNRIMGIIDIRHNLENAFLAQYGGHIGYSVRPSERRKGYATEILRKGLEYAKSLGILKVMLGCYTDNIPSQRTIERCGGSLSETKPYIDGRPMNIYWINLELI